MPPHTTTNATAIQPMGRVMRDDPRHPLYLGKWKQSTKTDVRDFVHDDFEEPHRKRRAAILAKHPEVHQLYGNEPLTAIIGAIATATQLVAAYKVGCVWTDLHWTAVLAIAYLLGGTISALYGVIIHEAGHNLVFKRPFYNRLTGLMVNLPMVVPISQSFRRYHLEHHQYQGVEGMDPDLPLDAEIKYIHNNPLLKTLWVFCYSAIFSIFGYGMHPGAAHFIQEHYIFRDGQETYSYYGSGNVFYLNIGLHNEHHDFPQIPWTRIYKLRRIATEFYDPLYAHTSWIGVIIMFITSPMQGPQARLVRMYKAHLSGRQEYKVPCESPPKNSVARKRRDSMLAALKA